METPRHGKHPQGPQYTHVYMTESPSHCPGSTPLSLSPSANPALSIQHSPAQAACTSGPRYTIIHTLIVLNHRAAARLCARIFMDEKPPDQAPSGEPSSCPPPQIPSPCPTLHFLVPRLTARASLGLSLRRCNLLKSARTSLQNGA